MSEFWIVERVLTGGRKAQVFPLTFGRARLGLLDAGCALTYERVW